MFTSSVSHPHRIFIGVNSAQYLLLEFVFWAQQFRWSSNEEGECILKPSEIAKQICLSSSCIEKQIDKLTKDSILIKDKGIKLNESVQDLMNLSSKEVLQRLEDQEKVYWLYTSINNQTISDLNEDQCELMVNEYVFLDMVMHSCGLNKYGKKGWCDHADTKFSELLGMSYSGFRKMKNRMLMKGYIEIESSGCRVIKEEIFGRWESDRNRVAKAEKEDKDINQDVADEIRWRMRHEYSGAELADMFDDPDQAVDNIIESWSSEDKELVPHPKKGRARDWKYQKCLRGFKKWVESFSESPGSSVIRGSTKRLAVERDLLMKTINAYHKPVALEGEREPKKLDMKRVESYLRQGYSIEDKRKYLVFNLLRRGKEYGFDINRILGGTILDQYMRLAHSYFDFKEWVGRPVQLDRYPPNYKSMGMPPGVTSRNFKATLDKGYFVEFDLKNKPKYIYDANGNRKV